MTHETLIDQLSQQAQPIKPARFHHACGECVAVAMISLAVISLMHGLRADLAERLIEPLFVSELALNLLLMMVAGYSATAAAFPDRAYQPAMRWLLPVLFIAYSGLIAMISVGTPPHPTPHTWECLSCIFSFAAIPALWMGWRLRKLACVRPMLAGGAVLMMAMAGGCLSVRLVEHEIGSNGLILTHYLPLWLMSAAGMVLGKKIFRW